MGVMNKKGTAHRRPPITRESSVYKGFPASDKSHYLSQVALGILEDRTPDATVHGNQYGVQYVLLTLSDDIPVLPTIRGLKWERIS